MKTTPEALKALYQTLGGSSGNVAGESKTTGILNKIAALFGSSATADKIPDAISNINAVASGITKPSGKKSITTTAETNVANYATAQISDANLVAGNIKKDVPILGITGEYEGSGGSSDFSTATITVTVGSPFEEVITKFAQLVGDGDISMVTEWVAETGSTTMTPILYNGSANGTVFFDGDDLTTEYVAVSGDISMSGSTITISGNGTIVIASK